MSEEQVPVSIEILEKEYMVSCPPAEKDSLLESAKLLNERMRQVRDSGKVYGIERMAVITALNIIHEFAQNERRLRESAEDFSTDLNRLENKITMAIGRRGSGKTID